MGAAMEPGNKWELNVIICINPNQVTEVLPDATPEDELRTLRNANCVLLQVSTVWGMAQVREWTGARWRLMEKDNS